VKVLVLNCGSSSVKFQLVETRGPDATASDLLLARGLIDSIGGAALVRLDVPGRDTHRETAEILDHRVAVERALELLTRPGTAVLGSRSEVQAVGHRVVHGGERFRSSVLIDDSVLRGIEECFDLAPLHNPPNVKGYRAARDLLPEVPQVAVFDTSFHQTMAPAAFLYALPYVLYERHGIRRYGFHGTSHRFVSRRLEALLGRVDDPEVRMITCHLGNGCSVAAVRGRLSMDTSMGFTPLEGLVMGTRSGDLDPAILLHVMAKEELAPAELSALLNKHSGLLGLSGHSNDMRSLLEAEAGGSARAGLAVDVFCYRLRKYIASYVGALGGVDAVAFAGGIGENAPAVRRRSLVGLEAVGLVIEDGLNEKARGVEAELTGPGSKARLFVVPTNEELLIAHDTFAIVSGLPPV
jgi:acetate kinase